MNLLAFLRIRKAEVLRRAANLLPIIFTAVLLVFAENSALEAYRTFERIEASNASEAIQAGRDIGDQAKLVEMSRRKLGNRLILGFTTEDANDIREALGRLLATIENARPSFIMPGDAALITQIDSIAELASGLGIAFANVGPDDSAILNALDGDLRRLSEKFRLLQENMTEQGTRYIALQGETLAASYSAMLKLSIALVGAIVSMLALLVLNRRATWQANYRADHDVTTGVLNRRAFERWIEGIHFDPQATKAVMVFDLDNFKEVNDELGHMAGDHVLKAFVRNLVSSFGQDALVVRWGGDEFVVVVSTDGFVEAGAVTLLRASFQRLQSVVRFGDTDIDVRCSGGAAVWPSDSRDFHEVLQLADLALYKAKSRGKSRLQFYDTDILNERHKVLALRERLRAALRDGELSLYWQPQVDVERGYVPSAEALIRWTDKETGRLVPPGEFIPAAEASDLIIEIDNFVIEEAVATAARWATIWEYPPIAAVNVSAVHFQRREFVGQVRDILRRHNVSPDRLELEITEGVILGNNIEVTRNLKGLEALGVHVALDDFGTGYSNIAYLSQLKPDRLKIDQTFIAALAGNCQMESLVSAIIGIGKAIDCEVVAEGVETADQLELVQRLGCCLVQGYHFAKPMPDDEFQVWRDANYPDAVASVKHLRRLGDRLASVVNDDTGWRRGHDTP
jgi:diguanylate cyclase (GGDEF)-like protein